MGSLATTEQTGGSDPRAIQTTAVLTGGEWVLNGRKTMISRGAESHVLVLTAKTDKGISTFLVEKGMPGLRPGRRETFVSCQTRSSPVHEIILEDCRIPKDNIIGQEGRGLAAIMGTISVVGRAGGAAVCLGIAKSSYESALKYSKERYLYGKPLSDLQSIRFWLADMATKIRAATWLNYNMAWLADQGKSAREIAKETAMCKLFASEIAIDITMKAIEIYGGYGTAAETRLMKKLNAALDMISAAGSNNVLRENIGRSVLEE